MIVFFRHGKTKWNIEGRLQGSECNSELLPLEENFLNRIRRDFSNIKFEKIIVSPLLRAQEYFQILNLKGEIIETREEIAEISFGILSGKKISEIDKEIINERNIDKWNYRPKGGESYNDLYIRLEELGQELLTEGGDVAIVGHETSNKVLIGRIMEYSRENILRLKQSNETVYKIEGRELYKRDYQRRSSIWERL